MLSCDDFALSQFIIVILLKNWSQQTYASHGSFSTSSRDFYTAENMLDICSIHSGSLFEIAKCYCDSVSRNQTLSSQSLNQRLQPNTKRLLVSMIRTETILPHRTDKKQTFKIQGALMNQFKRHHSLLITYKKHKNHAESINNIPSPTWSHTLYLPERFGIAFVKTQLLYLLSTDIRVVSLICSVDCTFLVLKAAAEVGFLASKYMWLVDYVEIDYLLGKLPGHVIFISNRNKENNYAAKRNDLLHCRNLDGHSMLMDIGGRWIYKRIDNKLEIIATYHEDIIKFNSEGKKMKSQFLRIDELLRRNIRVVTVIDGPFTLLHEDSHDIIDFDEMKCSSGKLCWRNESRNNTTARVPYCCYGYCIDLIQHLEDDLSLIPDIYIVEDSTYGQIVNGSWVGMVGDIVRGKADLILASLSMNTKRGEYIDFSHPYLTGGVAFIVMEKRSSIAFFNFDSFAPLSNLLWVITFVVAFLASFVLVAIERKGYTLKKTVYPWSESITYLAGLVFQKDIAGANPKRLTTRILSILLAISMMIIMSAYTAVLTANKVTYESKLPITGIHDKKVTNPSHKFKFGTLKNSLYSQMFVDSTDPTWSRIGAFMKHYNYIDSEAAFAKLRSGELDAIFHSIYGSLHYMSEDCRLKVAGEIIPESGFSLGVQKNSHLTNIISETIQRYNDDGILKKINEKWFPDKCTDVLYGKNDNVVEFSINYFGGLFLVLMFWFVLSCIVFLLEMAVMKYKSH
ncbi:glutamate receptor ionotropic, NMDA 3A-like isoform X2 [Hydractinia symbiolongicarpus]|uniref:glutamate receptor ionotropic, NMDA 3A-like isoform X2 n=1 Tax=Hydractinia symbiolongicarpus TaxID=13093 RepID=UPI002550E76F|nr:glutamate receptor ionotropic, NMDA 3A-like isoform X2 [Hydractinia symbiolongicarpus]